MAVAAVMRAELTVAETLTSGVDLASDKTVTHSLLNTTARLTGSSSPAASKVAAFDATLVAGALTLDLTALGDAAADMTGLKLRAALLKGKSANVGAVTMKPGASDGYQFMGASGQVQARAGDVVLMYLGDGAPTVGGAGFNVDLAGAGVDVLQLVMVFG